MDLDSSSLFASLLVSSVGFVAFSYGKSQRRFPQLVTGVVLMVYPYFVDGVGTMLLVGALLVGLMTAAIKLGY